MDKIRDAIKYASELAEESPGKYQVAVFTEVLRHRLQKGSSAQSGEPRFKGSAAESTIDTSRLAAIADSVSKGGNRMQQAVWAVLRLAEKGEEANNETIREVIKTELSVTPQTRMDTNRTLKKLTPKYLRREKRDSGRGLKYIPSRYSSQVFEDLEV